MAAELRMNELAKHPAITLKRYIDTNWSRKTDAFVGPEPPEEIKARIRDALVTGITDPLNKIRVAVAYVVAKIATLDWPEAWPNLFDVLMANLKSSNSDHVHGAMRVLSELARDSLAEQQFLYVAPVLIPELYRIFCAENFSVGVRARSLVIFREYLETLFMIQEENRDAVAKYLMPVLPTWLDTFQKILSHVETPMEVITIKHEVMLTVVKLVRQFPKQMSPFLLPFLQPVWNHVLELQSWYISERIVSSDTGTENVDSDGHVISLDSLLHELLQFLQCVQSSAGKKQELRSVFSAGVKGAKVTAPSQLLSQLMGVAMTYLQITADMFAFQEETWSGDMNQFIQDDEDEAMIFNVRIAIEELLMALLDGPFPIETLQALCGATTTRFEESAKARRAGDPNWWKVDEACLLALGRVSDELVGAVKQQQVSFDFGGFFQHIVLEDMQCREHPFLQGRAIWFSSQFASVLPSELVAQCMKIAVAALKEDSTAFAVKVLAIKALRNFCDNTQPEALVPYQADVIESIVRLAHGASDEALILLLEALTTAVKVNDEVTARYESAIGPLLLNVWVKGAQDMVMTDIVEDLFKALAVNQHMTTAFQQRMLPAVRDALRAENVQAMPEVTATALDLLSSLMKNAPTPFAPAYTAEIFPDLIKLLLTAEEHAILQAHLSILIDLTQPRDL
ncbi:Importin 9 [Borealophlyctis nickersoniae]|nr:Importin 9 [Borealophlyctis nickersoniae]